MKIAIGNDHAGLDYKNVLVDYIKEKYGYEVVNFGNDVNERDDSYVTFAKKVAGAVSKGEVDKGILICGTGVGMSLCANKYKGVRCVVCSEPFTARLSRKHNDTNVLAFGARVIGIELAKMIVDEWLTTSFEGGRHKDRIDSIAEIENGNY